MWLKGHKTMANDKNNDEKEETNDLHATYWFLGWMILISLATLCLITYMLLSYGKGELLKDLFLMLTAFIGGAGTMFIGIRVR